MQNQLAMIKMLLKLMYVRMFIKNLLIKSAKRLLQASTARLVLNEHY